MTAYSFNGRERALLQRRNLALIGFMGVGKTTVSGRLRELLGMREVDTDAMIVEREGRTIARIFAEEGEAYFRAREAETILALQKERGLVISCGGGVVMRQDNVDNLRRGSRIVLLSARPETILSRIGDATDRPLLNGHMNAEYIARMMEQRRPAYEAAADITVATDGKSPGQICREIVDLLLREEEQNG